MIASIGAALYADRKRPAVWTIGTTWLTLALAFGLGIPYLVSRVLAGDPAEAEAAEELLSTVLPQQLVATGLGVFPLFGGAIAVILGAMVIGNEYRWGTLHLIFTQRPRRTQVIGGHAIGLVLLVLGLVVATLVAMAGVTAVLAAVEGRDISWPAVGELLRAAGAAWLICAAFASVGFFLATLFRSTATAIAVGLVWTLVIENAVTGLAQVLAPFEVVQKVLLTPSAGALAGALGAPSQFEGGTPGVMESAGGVLPTIVLLGYVVLAIGGALWMTTRRDVG